MIRYISRSKIAQRKQKLYFLNDVLSDTTSLFSENNILGNDLSVALEKSCET